MDPQPKREATYASQSFSCLLLLFCFFFLAPIHAQGARAGANDVVVKKTMASFSKIPGLTERELEYGRQFIEQMNYNSQRITRQISLLPGASFAQCKKIWDVLEHKNASYDQILAFEEWTKLPGATMPLAVQVLSTIRDLTREEVKCLRAFLKIRRQEADALL
ncbi:MAG: hypothetical protein D3909_18665, partial [Candidatus Electrothrix sp. ATG1]|nr:hypothetical protein [Candidatus Electrothrix sp. ATG1]